jgi:hypothetical protein
VQKQLLLCVAVCKGWKLATQRVAYHSLTFTVPGFNKITTVFESKDLKVRQLVKELSLFQFSEDHSEAFSVEHLESLALIFPHVEKIIGNEILEVFHCLVDICTSEKRKYLKQLPQPLFQNELVPYTSCVLASKNSISHLGLIGRTRLGRASRNVISNFFPRQLKLFDTTRNDDPTVNQQYDSSIEKCAGLKKLCFNNFYKTATQPTMTLSTLAQVKKGLIFRLFQEILELLMKWRWSILCTSFKILKALS